MKNRNPYIYGRYLRPKYFCGRKRETENILECLNQNKNILLIGRNGLGKTALIKHTFYQLSKSQEFITLYIDIIKTTSFSSFIEELFNSTIKDLKNSSSKKSAKLEKLLLSDSDDKILEIRNLDETWLNKKIVDYFEFLNSTKYKVVLAIDNYHFAAQFPLTKFENLFFKNLNEYENISLFLAGTKTIISENTFNVIELCRINSEEYRKFIIKKFSSIGFSISEKSIKRIFEYSNRETRAIQIICSKLIELDEKKIKSKLIDSAIEKTIQESALNFEMIKLLLSPYQWKLLLAIAIEKEATFVTSNGFIEKYKLNAPSSVKTALDALLEKELIFRFENTYFITNSIFRHWLISK